MGWSREKLRADAQNWEHNAKKDALWSILTEESGRGGRWVETDFFATGLALVGNLFAKLAERGIVPRRGRALDFGCGVGRLTQALGERFDEVIGVDASATMIAKAEAFNRHGVKVRYVRCDEPKFSFVPDGSVDFILSMIVLQHIPPPHAEAYLAELARKLAPGGFLVVQAIERAHVPHRPSWRWRVRTMLPPRVGQWLRERLFPDRLVIPMYPLSREKFRAALAGLKVLSSEPDELAAGYDSFTTVAKKP